MEEEEHSITCIKEELPIKEELLSADDVINDEEEISLFNDPLHNKDSVVQRENSELSLVNSSKKDDTSNKSGSDTRPVPKTYGNRKRNQSLETSSSKDFSTGRTESEVNFNCDKSAVMSKKACQNIVFAPVKAEILEEPDLYAEPGSSDAEFDVRCMDSGDIVHDELLYCLECLCAFSGDCPKHGALLVIPDTPILDKEADEFRALKTAPLQVTVTDSKIPNGGRGVIARTMIPDRARFGPYEGRKVLPHQGSEYAWLIRHDGYSDHCIDGSDSSASNWMRFVNCARSEVERNLLAFQYQGQIYFRTIRLIRPGEELLVWCGNKFAEWLGIDPTVMDAARFRRVNTKSPAQPTFFACPICPESFETEEERNGHRGIHKDGDSYVCPVCNKKMALAQNMKRHMMTHSGEKPFPCSVCDQRFSQRSLMQRHMRVHTGEKPYMCVECEKRFPREDELNRHLRSHIGDKPYKCDMCDKKFGLKDSLTKHRRSVHEGKKSYLCQVCSKDFCNRHLLRAHVVEHYKDKTVSCPKCRKNFLREEHLLSHLRLSHCGDNPFACAHCTYAFPTEQKLSKHMKVHDADALFACNECDQLFSTALALKVHAGHSHGRGKPFVCQECGKRYKHQRFLSLHLMHHKKPTEFAFVDCNAEVF